MGILGLISFGCLGSCGAAWSAHSANRQVGGHTLLDRSTVLSFRSEHLVARNELLFYVTGCRSASARWNNAAADAAACLLSRLNAVQIFGQTFACSCPKLSAVGVTNPVLKRQVS